jgi:ubiquinone/menaquinone biosynthesis C-methylase UbiE
MHTHAESVHQQFDPQGQAYLTSAVHAQGPDLVYAERLVAQALPTATTALDVGCGAGHLSFRLCRLLNRVAALDPSAGMLATVAREAAARGLENLATYQASVESLPFPGETYDLVATRYSAHHWSRMEAALAEMRRVTRAGGALLLIDALAPEEALIDTHFQAMELLRDPSHVRNRSVSEWQRLLAAAGFEIVEQQQWSTRIDFASWIERMRTSSERVAAIRSLQLTAPVEVQQALALEPDGSFVLHTGLFWARRVG